MTLGLRLIFVVVVVVFYLFYPEYWGIFAANRWLYCFKGVTLGLLLFFACLFVGFFTGPIQNIGAYLQQIVGCIVLRVSRWDYYWLVTGPSENNGASL